MNQYLGEFKDASKDEVIEIYDDIFERLLNKINQIQGEIDKLKKEEIKRKPSKLSDKK